MSQLTASFSLLQMAQPLYEAMLLHLQALYPEEGCGLLAGQGHYVQAHKRTATTLYAIPNQARSASRYLMEPHWQLTAFLEAERKGLALLAIYHCHPHGPDTPSSTDMAQAYYPDLVQVVVSLANKIQPSVRAFRLTPTNYKEIMLVIE
ncbi:MAG: M67 family metallopeptidase [Chloroflexota bacterium]